MAMLQHIKTSRWLRTATLAAAGLASISLSGCIGVANYASPDPVAFTDYHERHAIALTHAPTAMDIYPVGGRLDDQSAANVRTFAEQYKELGTGSVAILMPSNGGGRNQAVVSEIRRGLYANGLRGKVYVSSYRVADPALVAPVRLVYDGIKATLPGPCGRWPTDIGAGEFSKDVKNESYENYGCATQAMLANQVADPRDLVRERATTPPDVEMRMRAIESVRKGNDPGTSWKTQTTTIGTVGGG